MHIHNIHHQHTTHRGTHLTYGPLRPFSFRIDGEVHRLNHKHEIDNERLQKQREWAKLEPTLPQGFDFEEGFTLESTSLDSASNHGRTEAVPGFSGMDRGPGSTVQRRKDERMASNDPARYCADRCVSTGNCDVFEDMFDLGELPD